MLISPDFLHNLEKYSTVPFRHQWTVHATATTPLDLEPFFAPALPYQRPACSKAKGKTKQFPALHRNNKFIERTKLDNYYFCKKKDFIVLKLTIISFYIWIQITLFYCDSHFAVLLLMKKMCFFSFRLLNKFISPLAPNKDGSWIYLCRTDKRASGLLIPFFHFSFQSRNSFWRRKHVSWLLAVVWCLA